MNQADTYLLKILAKYAPHDLSAHAAIIADLRVKLIAWAGTCYIEIINSGSRAKGTAISIASDVDYLISLTSDCNNIGGLKAIYESLCNTLNYHYPGKVRNQNVSVRLKINGLEVDVTPAKRQSGYIHYHSIWLSKLNSWRQTNIQTHINDVSTSGRTNEIKLVKIWRELFGIDFPSIYLEYLLISVILNGKSKGNDYLAANFWYVINELAKDTGNPLFSKVVDPANTGNILSDLLTIAEKNKIIAQAKIASKQSNWDRIVW